MASVDEGDDIIDSRDVIARIEELESERETFLALHEDVNDGAAKEAAIADAAARWDADDDGQELAKLKALASEAEGYAPDWHHGEALIRDDYFEQYAQQVAEDVGSYDAKSLSWPLTHIDWKAAAEALQQDYTSVEFGSTTYWIRS